MVVVVVGREGDGSVVAGWWLVVVVVGEFLLKFTVDGVESGCVVAISGARGGGRDKSSFFSCFLLFFLSFLPDLSIFSQQDRRAKGQTNYHTSTHEHTNHSNTRAHNQQSLSPSSRTRKFLLVASDSYSFRWSRKDATRPSHIGSNIH
ncbi:hypothetical protein DFJ73DRAFT_148827 [Zopfochytrium polystomum]|nr:hypothetical protein DFJ73DRAFT_148827 [Zopfochytrium polystomum]